MKRWVLLIFFIVFVDFANAAENPVVRKMGQARGSQFLRHKIKYPKKKYISHHKKAKIFSLPFVPPSEPVRAMAEWEPCQGVALSWIPVSPPDEFDSMCIDIMRYMDTTSTVYIVVPSNSARSTILARLSRAGIYTGNIQFIIQNGFENPWIRDFGGLFVYNPAGELACVDPVYSDDSDVLADNFPRVFSSLYGLTYYDFPVCDEGGNYLTDGHGLLIQTDYYHYVNIDDYAFEWTEEELDSLLKVYFNLERIVTLPVIRIPDTCWGFWHIDVIAKIVNDSTILLSYYPDTTAIEYGVLENCARILDTLHAYDGRRFTIYRVPTLYDSTDIGPGYYTYTNSLILNHQVFVPVYNIDYDTMALRIYREAMPGYQIIPILNRVWDYGGGVHCLTRDIPLFRRSFVQSQEDSHPDGIGIDAFPNPFNSRLHIRIDCGSDLTHRAFLVAISNITGETIEKFEAVKDFEWVPESGLSSGVYFIRVNTVLGAASKPVIYLK